MIKKFKKACTIGLSVVMATVMMTTSAYALSYNGSDSYKSGKYYTALTKVKLTGNKRTDIVNIAKSQIGYHEGNNNSQLSGTSNGTNNYTEFGRWIGCQDMWCASFVSWCAFNAGAGTSVIKKTASTVAGLQQFIDQKRAYTRANVAAGKYTPKAGDIVYFKGSRNSAKTNHVGIVTKYSDSTLYTVEGNTSSSTYSSNGGVVAPHTYKISNTYIVYICSPNYDNKSKEKDTGNVEFVTLKSGSSGYRVKALQFMLNYWTKSGLTVDGKFGAKTTAAVKKFQKAKGLTQDGVVGSKTWVKMTTVSQSTSNYNANLTKAIQTLLNNKNSAGLTVDGAFGPKTKTAVINFQKKNGLKTSGVVDATTWKYLLS